MSNKLIFDVLLLEHYSRDKAYYTGLTQSLNEARYRSQTQQYSSDTFLKTLEKLHPDVVLLAMDFPTQEILNSLQYLAQINPFPVVVLTQKSDAISIDIMMQCGVSCCIVGDVNPSRMNSILEVALSRFKYQQRLKSELGEMQRIFLEQKLLTKAKMSLMEQHQLTENEAHHRMRKIAMDTGKKMDHVAKNVLNFITQTEPS